MLDPQERWNISGIRAKRARKEKFGNDTKTPYH